MSSSTWSKCEGSFLEAPVLIRRKQHGFLFGLNLILGLEIHREEKTATEVE